METELNLKPQIKNYVPDEEKFKLPLDKIMEAATEFAQDAKFIPSNNQPSVEYRPGVRKYTAKELDRILGKPKPKHYTNTEEMFSHYIDNHCQCSSNVDKEIIDKRRKLPVQLMGLEKSIETEKWLHTMEELTAVVREIYDDNHIFESNDGKIIHMYSVPVGYYTDYDGGRSTSKGNIFYKIFEDTEIENAKKKTITITTAAENGIRFLESLCNDCNGLIGSNDPLSWATSRFFSIVIKCGYSVYDTYHDYKYNKNHPSHDTHSYMRVTFIPGGK